MNTLQSISSKFVALPSTIKAWIITGVISIVAIAVCVFFYTSGQDAKVKAKIEVLAPKIEDAKKESAQNAKDLKNDVVDHGKAVQKTATDIQEIVKKRKPFKPMKHEAIKIKDASYDAMRRVLDTARPNK